MDLRWTSHQLMELGFHHLMLTVYISNIHKIWSDIL
jgi:hypothetical protein